MAKTGISVRVIAVVPVGFYKRAQLGFAAQDELFSRPDAAKPWGGVGHIGNSNCPRLMLASLRLPAAHASSVA